MPKDTHYVDRKQADGYITCACEFAGYEKAFLAHIESARKAIAARKAHEAGATDKTYCGDCDGVGWVEGGEAIKTTCKTCEGTGWAP